MLNLFKKCKSHLKKMLKRAIIKPKYKKQTEVKITCENFILSLKKFFPVKRHFKHISPESLNEKQTTALEYVQMHMEEPDRQLLLIIPGTQGTGKSFVIHALRTQFQKYNLECKVFSYTGSSAFNASGTTFHQGLSMGYFSSLDDPSENIESVKKNLRNVEYFIFDEISLISTKLICYVSKRLQEAFGVYDKPFGNKNVIMFGDLAQLRPVGGFSLFKNPENLSGFDKEGADLYKQFTSVIWLSEGMRQVGDKSYENLLARVRNGELTEEDEEKLTSRNLENLTSQEVDTFTRDGVFLFAEKAQAESYNKFRVGTLNEKIYDIPPLDVGKNPKVSSVVSNLEICKGARVMLNQNLYTEAGLYNGARGIVTEIVEDPSGDPKVIFVKFDTYYGRPYGVNGSIPIVRVKLPVMDVEVETLYIYPLSLAFAITCHKAQGLTLPKVCIGIPPGTGRRNAFFTQAPSMLFVCLSRVKSLLDICFTKSFRKEAVKCRSLHYLEWSEEEKRLKVLEDQTLDL